MFIIHTFSILLHKNKIYLFIVSRSMVKKTKLFIFGRGKNISCVNFEGSLLKVDNNFKYIGVTIRKSNSFNLNIKKTFWLSYKSNDSVIGKCKNHDLTIECKIDMFDKIIKLVLWHGCEV